MIHFTGKLIDTNVQPDANLFKDAFIKAQKDNDALFSGASPAPAATAEEKKEESTEEKKVEAAEEKKEETS